MDGQIDNIFSLLGTLGAYFAIILILSVVVETILDMIKLNPTIARWARNNKRFNFLDLQKQRISPEQAMRDVAFWIPPRSQPDVQVAALNNLMNSFGVALEETTQLAEAGADTVHDLIAMTGLNRQAAEVRTQLASKMYAVRQLYDVEESQRIIRVRRLAGLLGIIVAGAMGLNTFAFLQPLFSPDLQAWMGNRYMSVAGMILTGFAASAGSSFWHDQLDRVRAVKTSARAITTLVG